VYTDLQVKLLLFDFADLLEKLPADMQVLVIHGEADQIIPFECSKVNKSTTAYRQPPHSFCSSQEILRRIPGSRFIEFGPEPGKLPTLQFGHNFSLYFAAKIWDDVITEFLRIPEPSATSPEPITTPISPESATTPSSSEPATL
jgi:hypothetical protein